MALDPRKMFRYTSVGVEFSSPIIAGALLGHYLDLHFRTDPYLTLIMLLLGVVAGFVNLIRRMRDFQKGA